MSLAFAVFFMSLAFLAICIASNDSNYRILRILRFLLLVLVSIGFKRFSHDLPSFPNFVGRPSDITTTGTPRSTPTTTSLPFPQTLPTSPTPSPRPWGWTSSQRRPSSTFTRWTRPWADTRTTRSKIWRHHSFLYPWVGFVCRQSWKNVIFIWSETPGLGKLNLLLFSTCSVKGNCYVCTQCRAKDFYYSFSKSCNSWFAG